METRNFLKFTAVASLLAAGFVPCAPADESDFHYVRPYGSRSLIWRPRDSFAVVGGQVYYSPADLTSRPPTPNNWLTFRHPYTQAYVSVPVSLPDGMPRIVQHTDRVIYDYGLVSVIIHFVRDGSVNVAYNTKTP